jgi:YHS domain-containing protein
VKQAARKKKGTSFVASVSWWPAEKRNRFCKQEALATETSIRGGMMTTDPVCGMKIDEKNAGFHLQFEGKKYYFCSENCKQEFETDPEQYAESAAA